jgi:REP element-mobilizing transposase RayT
MARARKRHVQQELFKGRGGKRPGAGRPPKGKRAGSPHKARPELNRRYPVHVVLRVVRELGSLRRRRMYKAFRAATIAVALRELNWKVDGAFRIVHVSIQRTHVHLIVEADHKLALARGMQSFQISAAKHLNAAVSVGRAERRRGTVFPDRYHQEILTTPTRCRRALAYVLNNWRKHGEDRTEVAQTWNVDPFSTGIVFTGWKEREGELFLWKWRDTYEPLVVYLPKSWLLSEGWRRGGPLVGFREVPSSRQLEA